MAKWDLTQAATALWIPVAELPPDQIGGSQNKMFDELRSAVLFVMDELLPEDRGTAMIQTDQGMVSIREIEKLYKNIKSE
jgi:hypothetical protein